MARKPNILVLMTDQMQGRVLEPGHPCRTPNFDKLAARGVRIARAYTPNAVCSPARASMMTGVLPHTHGVFSVNHCTHTYHCDIQPDLPHFAQRLVAAGYRTAYFGKWHVERSGDLARFGWQVTLADGGATLHRTMEAAAARFGCGGDKRDNLVMSHYVDQPDGYPRSLLYGVTRLPPEARYMGAVTHHTLEYLEQATQQEGPWCCFASIIEPHDPFVCGEEAYRQYDPDALPIPANWSDPCLDKPNVYRKVQRPFAHLTERQKREAAACYYASITELDQQYGRILDLLEARGQLDNTVVVLTTDHGEMLGGHGLYMKNYGAFEEIYHIPMLAAGPGIPRGAVADARVGLHDLAPTLCELGGADPVGAGQSRSFAPVLRDPANVADFQQGFAEYFGTRYWLTQRVIWDGPWKLVWNGFDFDELYNLDDDPQEMRNRIDDASCRGVVRRLMKQAWKVVKDTDDHPLLRANYPVLRAAPLGPNILDA